MIILIISGLSGAGKSKAASFLEDMGFYIVDNMPAAMILKFAEFCAGGSQRYDKVALVYDVRTANSPTELFDVLDVLKHSSGACSLLFLEAEPETIIKRYKETRRRHPLMESGATIEDAVKRETELLRPLRERADFVIDTTQLSAAKLRGELYRLFAEKGQQSRMSVNVVSFGYKYGVPLEAYVSKFVNMRFEPSGMTDDQDIRMAQSIMDYIFRRLALDYLDFDERGELGIYTADERAHYVERATMHNQHIVPLDQVDPLASPYFSMILVPGEKWRG